MPAFLAVLVGLIGGVVAWGAVLVGLWAYNAVAYRLDGLRRGRALRAGSAGLGHQRQARWVQRHQ